MADTQPAGSQPRDFAQLLEDPGPRAPGRRLLHQKAREASDFLKAMAHENRLLILCLLCERERSVTELEQLLELPQPTVSQQLARLRLEGIVDTRRDGRAVYYHLTDPTTRAFIQVLYDKFCRG